MAKLLGALPRVLQDRHDTLRMTMQVNDADGDGTKPQTTTVSMWRLTGRRRPEKSLRRVTTLTLLAWEEEKTLLAIFVFAWEKKHVPHLSSLFERAKIKLPPDCWDRPPRLWSSAPRCPAQCSASTPGVQVPNNYFQVSKQVCTFSGVYRQELDLFHGLSQFCCRVLEHILFYHLRSETALVMIVLMVTGWSLMTVNCNF